MKETSDGAPSPEELSLLEENYSTLQSFLSISHENITVEYSVCPINVGITSFMLYFLFYDMIFKILQWKME